jgi:hypothetical protein
VRTRQRPLSIKTGNDQSHPVSSKVLSNVTTLRCFLNASLCAELSTHRIDLVHVNVTSKQSLFLSFNVTDISIHVIATGANQDDNMNMIKVHAEQDIFLTDFAC